MWSSQGPSLLRLASQWSRSFGRSVIISCLSNPEDEASDTDLWVGGTADGSAPAEGIVNSACKPAVPPRPKRGNPLASPRANTNSPELDQAASSTPGLCSPNTPNSPESTLPTVFTVASASPVVCKLGRIPSKQRSFTSATSGSPVRFSLPVHDTLADLEKSLPRELAGATSEPNTGLSNKRQGLKVTGNTSSQNDSHKKPGSVLLGAVEDQRLAEEVTVGDNQFLTSSPSSRISSDQHQSQPSAGSSSQVLEVRHRPPPLAPGRMKVSQSKNSVKSIFLHDKLKLSNSAAAADGGEYCDSLTPDCSLINNNNNIGRHQALYKAHQTSPSAGVMERRRRNFSSTSLPLCLMSTQTIEEVDDVEESHHTSNDNQFDHISSGQSGQQSGQPQHQQQQQQQQYQQQQYHQQQRSNSYGGSVTPRAPRVPLRVLRREARVPSMGSPPRTHHHLASCTASSCSSFCDSYTGATTANKATTADGEDDSRNTSPCSTTGPPSEADTTLSDVDIVGESFTSRYPWQRDVGVQCALSPILPSDYRLQYNAYHDQQRLQRARSGPAKFSHSRSMSVSSNITAGSPGSSSPPSLTTHGRPMFPYPRPYAYLASSQQHQRNTSSLSLSDLTYPRQSLSGINRQHQLKTEASVPASTINYNNKDFPSDHRGYNHVDQQCQNSSQGGQLTQPHHKPPLYRSHTASPSSGFPEAGPGGPSQESPFSSRRANFKRRPRPSSMGAVENIRYQHELTKFRELHGSRRDRKSDPQLVLSPGGRHRVALLYPEDAGSWSDLESILENPGNSIIVKQLPWSKGESLVQWLASRHEIYRDASIAGSSPDTGALA
ncbi:hypothetical protein PoB_004206800 [Plakobranchus ocellatus]|uniref:Uncharacterized protein n=1 Tax=Plakobranchus ocellatus TaxID=259542 RepID=A0AAV4B7H5_9GAST|nr:hypothetical protein PoB_004206800 [Plakobranchus ocellatus]